MIKFKKTYAPYIMLVEDNTKLRKKIKSVLKSVYPSFEIGEASGEQEVLDKIRARQPDFMIIDISLSAGDGLQLTRKIKNNYPDITIAINTNNDSPEYHAAAMRFGADYFLSKKSNTINELISLPKKVMDTRLAKESKIKEYT